MALSNIAANKLMRNDGNGAFVEDMQAGIGRPTQEADYSSVTWGAGSTTSTSTDGRISTCAAGNLQRGALALPSACSRTRCSSTTAPASTFLDVSAATGADDTRR